MKISVRIPLEVRARLDRLASVRFSTTPALIREAVTRWLAQGAPARAESADIYEPLPAQHRATDVRFAEDTSSHLRAVADARHTTMSASILQAVTAWLDDDAPSAASPPPTSAATDVANRTRRIRFPP